MREVVNIFSLPTFLCLYLVTRGVFVFLASVIISLYPVMDRVSTYGTDCCEQDPNLHFLL